MGRPGRVAVFVTLALASCGGQSSSRSGSNEGGATSGASGTSASGGSATTGGASGTTPTPATGGAAPTGCAAGSGGASAGAAGRPVNTDPECADIRRDTPCALEGKECRAVACGLDDAFRRDCLCATNWTCTTCDNGFPTRPDVDIPLCPDDVVVGGPCAEISVCGPLDNCEYCACYAGEAGLVWDCAAPPGLW